MASSVDNSHSKKIVAYSFPQKVALNLQPPASCASMAAEITAVSIEFVAKPQEARRVEAAIPAAIAGALKYVAGFTGCLVMISEQEARLVTVVTLWDGRDRPKRCSQHVQCVTALLTPYFDRCLRVQTMVAHLPVLPMVQAENN
jgi:hypothetical protein